MVSISKKTRTKSEKHVTNASHISRKDQPKTLREKWKVKTLRHRFDVAKQKNVGPISGLPFKPEAFSDAPALRNRKLGNSCVQEREPNMALDDHV
jgi:hypothetical protein